MTTKINRRRSFRLPDQIQIWVRALDDSEYNKIVDDFDRYRLNYCLKSHFINQREGRQPKFQKLAKRDAEIASYIESLEEQIIMLADRLASRIDGEADQTRQLTEVNLSADGVKFETDQKLSVGQNVELGMDLPTNTTRVVMLATVVRSENETDQKQSIALEYTHVHDEDIEAIIRHMAKLQQIQLRERRAS